MPNKSKSRNTSRKSTASHSAPRVEGEDGFGFPGIVMKTKEPSSRKTTPKTPRPEFLEPTSVSPPPAPTPWETLGMAEEEFHAMLERVRQESIRSMRKSYEDAMIAELRSPAFWLQRIERLEKERERYNQKRGWSAEDAGFVDSIDDEIQRCQEELDLIYDEEDYAEFVRD